MTPSCAECGPVSLPADESRWRAYRSDDAFDENDRASAVAFFCPECVAREFSDDFPPAERLTRAP